ncbi:hypothetical protein PFICI_02627 [Pestalotiopsis fici W106-1]|uniref:Uncharacterized protein n=1 Tax=Pestalotiopsis fici (strain W106-1 / CGMCC3.15140) TaxID=1229662 RepID=W3XGN4_PESFW|nr:uncharacterized protein PFICI_02627 [Pestalotiopsis fici W106-1]ETS84602.1 hypothetical protein PFICI_02627 [Pestalotiopsis fici W106-1]
MTPRRDLEPNMFALSRQTSRASGRKSYKIWVDTWYWEILCLLFSIGLLVAMAVLLRVYDQQPTPYFQYGITLNTVIAVLTAFSKAALAVPTASGISQLKWQWYRNERALGGRCVRDIQIFDDASRGPWGALVLLCKLHVRTTASLGALVVVLALVLDPFAQQLITYSTRLYQDLDAPEPSIDLARFIIAGTNLDSVIYSSIWSEVDAPSIYKASECESDLCLWDNFDTLGFRPLCKDRTEEVVLEGCDLRCGNSQEFHTSNCSIYFPGDDSNVKWNFSVVQDAPDWVGSISGDDTENRTILEYPRHAIWTLWSGQAEGEASDWGTLFNVSPDRNLSGRNEIMIMAYAEIDFDPAKRPDGLSIKRAQVCALTPSVETLSVESHRGRLDVHVPKYTLGAFHEGGEPGDDLVYWSPDGSQDNILTYTDIREAAFFLDSDTLTLLCTRVRDALVGNYSVPQLVDVNRVCAAARPPADDGRNLAIEVDFAKSSSNQNLDKIADKVGGLEWAMQRVSEFLTHYSRTQPDEAVPVSGRAYSSRNSVEVWWPWLTLPVAVAAAGTVFLALVIYSSRGADEMLWKSSTLPLLYHGIDHRDLMANVKSSNVRADLTSSMDELSKRAKMRLRRSSIDGELRFHHS